MNEEEAKSFNRLITAREIETVFKNKLLVPKSPGPDGFTGGFYKTLKEELTLILLRLFQNNQRKRKTPKLFL